MVKNMKYKFKFFLKVITPLIVGIISSFFVDYKLYDKIVLPPAAPPATLFPIVWTILYILIGLSYALIRKKDKSKENKGLFIGQLLLNFIWVIVFFQGKMFLFSFMIIVFLDIVVLYTLLNYYKINKISAYLLIPYFLWICFASYLNWNIFLLN